MNSSSEHDPLDALAEAFLERYRRGERPALTEYVRQYPELAEQIRELFPTLVAMEQCHPEVSEPARAADRKIPEHLGEYRLLREVGRGGMGVVYEAVQESLGRHVALKVLPFNDLIDSRHLERFRREAKAAAQLHHTNIVPVFGVGEHQGIHFYAMQFIHGQGLDAVVREVKRLHDGGRTPVPGREITRTNTAASVAESLHVGRFAADPAPAAQAVTAMHPHPEYSPSPPTPGIEAPATGSHSELTAQPQGQYYLSVARLGVQAAEALEYAHRHGILHRDIKPGNLLLDTEGTLWVTDFGLAKAEGSDDLTHSGDLVGTLRYMAPERLRGEADARSDVYSLGLTLYELLTLQPAFDAPERGHVLDQVRHREPVLPRKLDPQIPRDLETIVVKAIAKDPRQRYATAAEMADDLRQFLAVRPIRARRSSVVERAWRWCRRNPAVAALSAGLVLALLLGLAGVTWKWREADRRAEAEAAQRERAEQAEEDAVKTLCDSYREQVRAGRLSRRPGQRFASLDALQKAIRIVHERHLPPDRLHELRNEAVACLALPDLAVAREWEGYPAGSLDVSCDETMQRYARANRQGEVRVCRVGDDALLYRVAGRGTESRPVLSPDGRTLVVWNDDGSLRAWRLTGERPELLLEVPAQVPYLAYAFDAAGRRLAVGCGSAVRIYPLDSSQRPLDCRVKGAPGYLAFHPSRPLLAVASGSSVWVHDLPSGDVRAELPHPARVSSLAWQPGGQLLATGCQDYHIYLWDWAERKLARSLEGIKNWGCLVAFNHSGSLLASMEWNGILRLWDPPTGRQLFRTPMEMRGAPRFSADDRLLGCSTDRTRLQIWRVAEGREYRTLVPDSAGTLIEVCPINGRVLAVPVDGGVQLWDLERRTPVGLLPSGRASFRFEASGALVSNNEVSLLRWPVREDSRPPGLCFGPPEKQAGPGVLYQVACSRDGGVIARADGDGALLIHRQPSGPPLRLAPHRDVRYVDVSPDGRWVATGSHSGTQVKIWRADDARLVAVLPVDSGSLVAFSPDGRWLGTSGDGCRLWHVPTWQEGPRLDQPGPWKPFAFSPDGRIVATETGHGVIRLMVAATGREVIRLEDPNTDRAEWLCFSPDAATLVAVGQTHALHVWDLRSLREGLAELGLDQDWPPFPPPQAQSEGPLHVEVLTAANK